MSSGPTNHPRRALERASAPLLMGLSQLPAWLVPVIMFVLALVGLFAGGLIGFLALGLIAVFLAWLALLSWPVLAPRQRLLRLLAVAVVAAAALVTLAS